MTKFSYFIKIILAKKSFLFWILLFYLLNISSFCIGSISWCCFVAQPVFSSSAIPWYPDCSASVPLFR